MSRTFYLLTTLIALILAVDLFQWPPSVLPTSQARDPSFPPAATEPNAPQPVELHQGLGSLPYLNHARSRSVCAENPTGAKGKGGMAVPNPSDPSPAASARAADDLGQGWKVRPFLRVNKGQTATLMDVDGPGVIQHIWIVEGLSRANVLRFYWDSEPTPSIEVPAPDFFAVGHGKFAAVNSLAVVVNPSNAMNCYWPMPFRKHVRVTLTNESPDQDLKLLAYQIDYAEMEVPANAAYFHAQFRRARTDRQNPYVILDGVRGHGRYVGTFLSWTQQSKGWFGEGEIKFYIDGDKEFPTICGTGTEDYFCGSYGFPRPFSGPYTGTTLPANENANPPSFLEPVPLAYHGPDLLRARPAGHDSGVGLAGQQVQEALGRRGLGRVLVSDFSALDFSHAAAAERSHGPGLGGPTRRARDEVGMFLTNLVGLSQARTTDEAICRSGFTALIFQSTTMK